MINQCNIKKRCKKIFDSCKTREHCLTALRYANLAIENTVEDDVIDFIKTYATTTKLKFFN